MATEHQVLVSTQCKGYVDHLPMARLAAYESELIEFFESKYTGTMDSLREVKKLEDDIVDGLEKGIKEFNASFQA